jgi:hypothetical protein
MKKTAEYLEWARINFEKVIFFGTLFLFLLVVQVMGGELSRLMKSSVNAFPYSDARSIKKYAIDFDRVADLIGAVKNPKDLSKYYVRDIFTEYKGEPIAQAVEEDKDAKGIKRFRLMKIFRQPVKLLFKGYMQLPDGSYSIQINWGEKTDFKKIGESMRGYKFVDFQQRICKEELQTGVVRETNKSIVEIQKEKEKPIILEKGRLVTEKELFAKIYDKKLLRNIVVYVGYAQDGYKILDITEGEVIVSTETGEVFHLECE